MNKQILDVLIGLAEDYFNNEPDKEQFILPKAVFCSKAGIPVNRRASTYENLAYDYKFITIDKSNLIIDKTGFYEWFNLKSEIEDNNETIIDINQKYPEMAERLERQREGISRAKNEMEAMAKELESNEKYLAEMPEKKEALKKEIEDLKSKVEEEREKTAELEKEREEQKEKALEEMAKREKEKKRWEIPTSISYDCDHSILWWMFILFIGFVVWWLLIFVVGGYLLDNLPVWSAQISAMFNTTNSTMV